MNEIELKDSIEKLYKEEKIKFELLMDKYYIKERNPELYDTFKKYYPDNYKWSEFVRLVLYEEPEIIEYMYSRLLDLVLEHARTPDAYFTMKTETQNYIIPNIIDKMNKLRILFKEYTEIYREIKNRIHFDFPKEDYSGSSIRGKINWSKTLQNSNTKFPLTFFTSIQNKKFETPGNILLILCAKWLNQDASQVLQAKLQEPINDVNRKLLRTIYEYTDDILRNFSFPTILNESKRYWRLEPNDDKIEFLESKARERIRDGIVRNPSYAKLLEWIKKFKDLNIKSVKNGKSTNHPLESRENMDHVYEAWIFFEFVNHLVHEKGIRPILNLEVKKGQQKALCEFNLNEVNVKFYYEKVFHQSNTWAGLTSEPDFCAMVDNEIIALFDAKNYTRKSSNMGEAKRAMLAYFMNLDVSFGALIFPNHPREGGREVLHPKENAKYISNRIEFSLLRMQPSNDEKELQFKKETLDAMFNAIARRIPLVIKS